MLPIITSLVIALICLLACYSFRLRNGLHCVNALAFQREQAIDKNKILEAESRVLIQVNEELQNLNHELVLYRDELTGKTQQLEKQGLILQEVNQELQRVNRELLLHRNEINQKNATLEIQTKLLLSVNSELQKVNHELIARKEEIDHQNELLKIQSEKLLEQNEELVQSQEEISAQRDLLSDQNNRLKEAQRIIEQQNRSIQLKNDSLEVEVGRRTADLTESYSQLEQFAFISAHNLRGPVARVLGLGKILEAHCSDENERKFVLQKLLKSTQELDSVIHDLSKILEIRTQCHKSIAELDVISEIEMIEKKLSKSIKESKATIKKEISEPRLKTIQPYFQSILYHLMSNSIKYRHTERHPIIVIQSEDGRDYYCLKFADNGLGIDLNLYGEKIFKLYNRFHFHVSGKGLGLYLIKSQLEAMRGKIEIDSKVGVGTTFKIYFHK